MWLVNTWSYALEFFQDDRSVVYAILSHRWRDDEVLFDDLQPGNDPTTKVGWLKLKRACQQAQDDNYTYLWVDTCCIDKKSSAELSEAINSMYRWYKKAKICYGYLDEVSGSDLDLQNLDNRKNYTFRKSDWFSRGWTLQELIAPHKFVFYNSQWIEIGFRHDLGALIHTITGIPTPILQGMHGPEQYSIAQRMSWAAKRDTTRAEDAAYSLMGLFDVNMPMLYGEGGIRAFVRLQEEIMKNSADQTIFASNCHNDSAFRGLLAHSPLEFEGCGDITQAIEQQPTTFQQTNLGTQIKLTVRPFGMDVYHAALGAVSGQSSLAKQVGIFLGCPSSTSMYLVGRRSYEDLDQLPFEATKYPKGNLFSLSLIVPRDPYLTLRPENGLFGFVIRSFQISARENKLTLHNGIDVVARPGTWNPHTSVVELRPGTAGATVGFAIRDSAILDRKRDALMFVKLGFQHDFSPWAWTVPYGNSYWLAAFARAKKPDTTQILEGTTDPEFFRVSALPLPETPLQTIRSFDSGSDISADSPHYHIGDRVQGLSMSTNFLALKIQREGQAETRGAWVVDFELVLRAAYTPHGDPKLRDPKAKTSLFRRL